MDQFPKMLYRYPGGVQLEDGYYATLRVEDQAGLDAALADGWFRIWTEARAAHAAATAAPAAQPQAAAVPADNAPPTRAELEQKAAELGIKVDGRWSDRKLRDLIAAELEA